MICIYSSKTYKKIGNNIEYIVRLKSYFKYLLRFLLLQVTLTVLTIYYFDNFLISNQEFKQKINLNVVSDTNRLIPFLNTEGTKIVTIDGFFTIIIFYYIWVFSG